MKDIVKEFVGKNQYGFIGKRSTKQAILSIDLKREHFTEHRRKGKLVMVDFSKAFDKLSSSAIKEAMNEAGVGKKLIWRILKLGDIAVRMLLWVTYALSAASNICSPVYAQLVIHNV